MLENVQVYEEMKRKIQEEIDREKAKITKKSRRREIIRILSKNGILYFLKDANFFSLFFKRKRTKSEDDQLRKFGRRLRITFEELGPAFIKLGQVLVTRQDILPEPITLELEQLLDEVPPIPFSHIQYILDSELPEGLATFEWIDAKPLGSGSLAQVYKAKLKTGEIVAVKVVRPTVEKLFLTDISIIKSFVNFIQKRLPVDVAAAVDLNGLITDYYSSSMNELNMIDEARTMDEHRALAHKHATIHVPNIYFATRNVLVMEFIDGWNLKEFPVDFLTFEERLERMIDLAHYYIETFLEGNYHGDAHGANLMLDKRTKKVVIIDFGLMGKMDALHSQAIFRMLLHIRVNQIEDAVECAMDIVSPTIYTDRVKLRDDYRAMMLHYVNSHQGGKYNWGRLVLEIIHIGMKNYCKIPNGLALWAKGFSATEGTARWLCPEVSYHSVVESADILIMSNIIEKRFNFRSNASLMQETMKLVGTLPRRLNKILETLFYNDLRMNIQIKMEKMTQNMIQQTINRLSLSIIIASMFLGVSYMIGNNPKARYFGLRTETIINTIFTVFIVLTIFLLWRLWKTRKTKSFF